MTKMKTLLEYIKKTKTSDYEPEELDINVLKVGDSVRVKSKEWYDKNKDSRDNVKSIYDAATVFTMTMSKFCGKTFKVRKIVKEYNNLILLDGPAEDWYFYPDWLEYAE